MKTSADVIVVGAGISGLSAARLLQESGIDVIVLEARERVGGRMLTIQNKKSEYVDLGASYISPTHKRVLKFIQEFGLTTFKTYEKGPLAYYEAGKGSKKFDTVFPPGGGFLSWLDMNNMIRLIYKMGSEIPLHAPWKAANAQKWDSMTAQEFINQNAWTRAGKYLISDSIRLNNTIPPHEVSLLYILWHYRTAGGIHLINATEGGAQEMKLIGGTQQLCQRLAETLGPDNVQLGMPIVKIDQTGQEVILCTLSGLQFQAQITFEPPLPVARNQLIQKVPMGCVMKAFCYYDTPFWKENGFCGSSNINDEKSLITYTMDNSAPDGSNPALVAFLVAENCRKAAQMSQEDRKAHVTQVLAKVFQSDLALQPTHYEEKDWSGEKYTGGCYFLALPPGVLTTYGEILWQPVGRVYFGGTETATQCVGYMEGGIQAGHRAARQVLYAKGLSDDAVLEDEEDIKCVQMSFLERMAPSVPGFFALLALGGLSLAAYSRL